MNTSAKWPLVRLATLAVERKGAIVGGPFGSDLVSRDYVESGVPVIRGGNLPMDAKFSFRDIVFVSEGKADSLRLNCAVPGDLVFTQRGTLGQVGLIPMDAPYPRFLISQSQMKMTVDQLKAVPLYLYYYFRLPSTISNIENHALQAGVPHINLGILRKFEVICPILSTQKKIAAILSAYDDLIESNQRRIALLEKMAEELYREWFVRLRFPGHKKAKFEKGVPDKWRVMLFKDIVDYYIGGGWGEEFASAANSEAAYVIRGTDIPNFNGGIFNPPHRFHKPTNLTSRTLIAGDFVFEISGGSKDQLLGRNVMLTKKAIDFLGGNVMAASFCKQIRFKTTIISPLFMKYFMKLFYTSDLVGLYQIQSTGISNYQFEAFLRFQSIIIPPKTMQSAFEDIVKPMVELKDDLALKNISLKKSREMLLPRLISGKLPVDTLNIHFPPSMQDPAPL